MTSSCNIFPEELRIVINENTIAEDDSRFKTFYANLVNWGTRVVTVSETP